MARAFDITTPSPTMKLEGNRRGEMAFTVTNSLGRAVRGRAVVVPEGATPPGWFSLVGEPERDFPRDGTHVFQVQAAVPPSQAAGDYAFHLLVAEQSNPDEHFADGPTVALRVPAPVVAPKRRIPWWIPAAAAAGLFLLLLVGVLLARSRDEGTGGSGSVTEPPVLSFATNAAYVDLGQPLSLEIKGPITLEAWIRPRNVSGVQNIVARGYVFNPNGEIFLRVLVGNYQVGSYMDGVPVGVVTVPAPSQDVNQWVHLAGVHDGERWVLYRNGEKLGEAAQPAGGGVPIDARWAIGARGGGGERAFNGNIRDVRIWSAARTQEQVREDMKRPPNEDEALDLAGYWPMDEGRNRRIQDRSGNEAHGFMHGATWGEAPPPPHPQ